MRWSLQTSPPAGAAEGPRVAILVETATAWGHGVVTGIQNFVRQHTPWHTLIEPRGIEEAVFIPPGWHGEGIIARINTRRLAHQLAALRLPVVNVSVCRIPGVDFPRVTTDLAAAGRMAARYLLERGHRHFGFFSLRQRWYDVAPQRTAFAQAVRAAGGTCTVCPAAFRRGASAGWDQRLTLLGHWLQSLHRPVAILTHHASDAREVLDAARQAHLRVPGDVAILSGSNDDLFCELAHVPLSAVQAPTAQIGYQAAALLARVMAGAPAPTTPRLLPPLSIHTRASTDALAVHDAALVKALTFIREQATRPLHVAEVAHHAGISRRLLELKFKALLARTPNEEIQRVRLAQAQALLTRTDMGLASVAAAAGFGSQQYFSYAFLKATGFTPAKFRQQTRSR